jgi:hypothetical protein
LHERVLINQLRETINLRDVLLDSLPERSPGRTMTCTASYVTTTSFLLVPTQPGSSVGHILFPHPEGQKSALVPPMKGHGPYSKILNWINSENARSEFVPSMLPSFATPSQPSFQNLHRLTYRVLETPTSPQSSQKILKLEIPLEPRDFEPGVDVTSTDLRHVLRASGRPRMWTGYQSAADMLIPHRSESAPSSSHIPR